MVELVGDDLRHLSDRQLLVVAAVERLAHGRLRLVDGEQDGVREVVDVAERDDAQPVVGEHEERSPIEDPADDAPLPGRKLARAVDVRVAEVRRGGVELEEQLLGPADAVALAVVRLGGEIGVLAGRDRKARLGDGSPGRRSRGRPERHRSTGGARPAHEHIGDRAEPAVHGDGDIELLVSEGVPDPLLAEHIAVQVPNMADLVHLVLAGMQHRDLVAAALQAHTTGGPVGPVPPTTSARLNGLVPADRWSRLEIGPAGGSDQCASQTECHVSSCPVPNGAAKIAQ